MANIQPSLQKLCLLRLLSSTDRAESCRTPAAFSSDVSWNYLLLSSSHADCQSLPKLMPTCCQPPAHPWQDVSWNYLRLSSAWALGKALEVNTSLTDLNLEYNTLGARGGEALGGSGGRLRAYLV